MCAMCVLCVCVSCVPPLSLSLSLCVFVCLCVCALPAFSPLILLSVFCVGRRRRHTVCPCCILRHGGGRVQPKARTLFSLNTPSTRYWMTVVCAFTSNTQRLFHLKLVVNTRRFRVCSAPEPQHVARRGYHQTTATARPSAFHDAGVFVHALPLPLVMSANKYTVKVICSNERILVWPFPGSKVCGEGVPDGALDPPVELSKVRSVPHNGRIDLTFLWHPPPHIDRSLYTPG